MKKIIILALFCVGVAKSKPAAEVFTDLEKSNVELRTILPDLARFDEFAKQHPDLDVQPPEDLVNAETKRGEIYKVVEQSFIDFSFSDSAIPKTWKADDSKKLL